MPKTMMALVIFLLPITIGGPASAFDWRALIGRAGAKQKAAGVPVRVIDAVGPKLHRKAGNAQVRIQESRLTTHRAFTDLDLEPAVAKLVETALRLGGTDSVCVGNIGLHRLFLRRNYLRDGYHFSTSPLDIGINANRIDRDSFQRARSAPSLAEVVEALKAEVHRHLPKQALSTEAKHGPELHEAATPEVSSLIGEAFMNQIVPQADRVVRERINAKAARSRIQESRSTTHRAFTGGQMKPELKDLVENAIRLGGRDSVCVGNIGLHRLFLRRNYLRDGYHFSTSPLDIGINAGRIDRDAFLSARSTPSQAEMVAVLEREVWRYRSKPAPSTGKP